MQRIRAEQFDSLDRSKFSYFTTGKMPRYYLLPVVLFLLTVASIIAYVLVCDGDVTLGLKIMLSAVFCLPICCTAIVILVKLIVAFVGCSKISFAIYNDCLYIKSRREYLIIDQKQLVDAAIKADSIRTRDMKRSQVPALGLDSGSIKLQTTAGDFVFSCGNLEKTLTVLLAIIKGKNIHTVLSQYSPSFDNNFEKGVLKVTTGFGFLVFLEMFTVMIGMLLGFPLAIIIVLANKMQVVYKKYPALFCHMHIGKRRYNDRHLLWNLQTCVGGASYAAFYDFYLWLCHCQYFAYTNGKQDRCTWRILRCKDN